MSSQAINAINTATGKPEIIVGEAAVVGVTLTNAGAPIALSTASKLVVYMPRYFAASDLAAMNISLKDWQFSHDTALAALVLSHSTNDGDWDGVLEFEITGVVANAKPAMDSLQINFQGMKGAEPQLTQPLPLVAPPVHGDLDLAKVLEVSLDSRGSVYVSNKFDPLANTLFLNIKNTGRTDIYTGTTLPTGAEISISFTYGNTSGALAPASADTPTSQPLGSAWNITPAMGQDQTEGWQISPPRPTDKFPVWRATPQATNKSLLGTGSHSNVTFELENIIALTPVGHTQMTISLTGFQKSETQNYADWVLVLDIYKQDSPPTRGLLNFFGNTSPIIPVPDGATGVDIPLRWAMADVNQVLLISSFPGVAPVATIYATPPNTPKALDYDAQTLKLPPTPNGGPVSLTLQALDGAGAFLNALQYTCFLQMSVFVDPRDKKEYPIALLGNRYWMIHNLDYEKEGMAYNDDSANEPTYGRLYPKESNSVQTPPGGWRLPAQSDWEDLIAFLGGPAKAYDAMTRTGEDAFNAVLGGQYDPSNSGSDFTDLMSVGNYWNTAGITYAYLNASGKTVSPGGSTVPLGVALSVRYVKDI